MARQALAAKMIKLLEATLNCDNVVSFVKRWDQSTYEADTNIIHKLNVNANPASLQIIRSDAVLVPISSVYKTFDYMTESNYTGFEYFPYIYGVLDCQKLKYVFIETFEGTIDLYLKQIDHQSDWYDVVFQFIIAGYHIQFVSNYDTGITDIVSSTLCRKLDKPYYKEYAFGSFKFNVNHKCLLALWFIGELKPATSKISTNVDLLIRYLKTAELAVPPSNRIYKLLEGVRDQPDETFRLLDSIYNQKSL